MSLPPAERAVHPSSDNDTHELFLMCDGVTTFIATMAAKMVDCSPVDEQRWGSIMRLTLPGGGKIGIYQPKHPLAAQERRAMGASVRDAEGCAALCASRDHQHQAAGVIETASDARCSGCSRRAIRNCAVFSNWRGDISQRGNEEEGAGLTISVAVFYLRDANEIVYRCVL